MKRQGIDLDPIAITAFCRKWKIKELGVFGSLLRSDFGPHSDIDFLAEFEDDDEWDLCDLGEMQDELGQIVGREVDLLEKAGVEASANRFLKKEILSTVERVHAA